MKRQLNEFDLPLVNLILDRDPDLAAQIFGRLDALTKVLSPITPVNVDALVKGPPPEPVGEDLEDKIQDWFKANPGKHTPGEIAGVFGATKTVKRATARLVDAKKIKWNGKRGPGSEYEGK